ncbi:MAG TPA: winged helix-turn-helix domain-containing protein [Pyrinomonadaceae bacterium]|nr:winged helix-turn-helix domain-containing protein [Pyrinomonadaceae bacterium]
MPHNSRYEFGPFQFDPSNRILTRGSEIISLTPKATDLLITLVTNAGEILNKDDLLKVVWPNTFIEESNLTQNIFTLRQALGDRRDDPRYIETVPRRGYRFVAAVRDETGEKHQRSALRGRSTASISHLQVLAVLPFINLTGNPDFEYLADNITAHLINTLSRASNLRVMSHSAVSSLKTNAVIAQQAWDELGATLVLLGKLTARRTSIAIGVELVDASTGWQLWGESFDLEQNELLKTQDDMTRELLKALEVSFGSSYAKRASARYTENAKAYESYLEGRHHWSEYTSKSVKKAVGHFRDAIESDPNYALAYAGIVDCFLRLASNYFPPENVFYTTETAPPRPTMNHVPSNEMNPRVKLRLDWDCKSIERELRRTNELKTVCLGGHQWFAAYRKAQELYKEFCTVNQHEDPTIQKINRNYSFNQIASFDLTANEEVQVYCAIAREQIDIGNYKAACKILRPWWSFGIWPKLGNLTQQSCADLLLTVGELAGCVASTKQLPQGQKHSEELLNGSVALFEQAGCRRLAAEGRIELAHCYYRQGLFDVGRTTLIQVLHELQTDWWELRTLALLRLATIERQAGKLQEALTRLLETTAVAELCGPWATGRCQLELASTYNELAVGTDSPSYFDEAINCYSRALFEFEGIGNHRLSAITENNFGLVMLYIGNLKEAEFHLLRARKTFDCFDDKIRCAQVAESLAQLYFAQGRLDDANASIERAVQTMKTGDEDAFLTEALTTKGLIYCKLKRYSQAKTLLENAYQLAQRCGDTEGAGRSLAILVEEMFGLLQLEEQNDIANRIVEMVSDSQEMSIHKRLQECLTVIRRR